MAENMKLTSFSSRLTNKRGKSINNAAAMYIDNCCALEENKAYRKIVVYFPSKENYPSIGNEHFKSPRNYGDGYQKGSRASAPVKVEAQKDLRLAPTEVPVLSLFELKDKTNIFGSKALIGEGSYGRMYYANLNDGKYVVVKKLDVSIFSSNRVSRVNPDNFVELLGYHVDSM